MKKTIFSILCAIFTGIVLAAGNGCVTTHTPPPDRRVTIAPDIASDVWITDARLGKRDSEHYTLQANIVNNSNHIVKIQYRVVFLDENGIELGDSNSFWRSTSISPKDIVGLTATAPIPGTVDFRIHVKKDIIN